MSRKLDQATVRHIAHLARLDITEADATRYAGQLSDILEYADQLAAVNVDGVEPTAHPLPVRDVLREDVPVEPLGAAKVLSNAPRSEADQFALPKVLDEGGA